MLQWGFGHVDTAGRLLAYYAAAAMVDRWHCQFFSPNGTHLDKDHRHKTNI